MKINKDVFLKPHDLTVGRKVAWQRADGVVLCDIISIAPSGKIELKVAGWLGTHFESPYQTFYEVTRGNA